MDRDIQIIGDNIKLQLNRSNFLDSKIINLIAQIQLNSTRSHAGFDKLVNELIIKSQDRLKFEGERIKEEARTEDLSAKVKKKLVKNFG